MVGLFYEKGIGTPVDPAQAKQYTNLALKRFNTIKTEAEIGNNRRAMYVFGKIHANGQVVEKNNKVAFKWFKEAAEREDADAQLEVGLMYESGSVVPHSFKDAESWLKKAAEQGNAAAQNELGLLWRRENSIEPGRKYPEAIKWFTKASEQNDPEGHYNLGFMHEKGWGFSKSYGEAMKLYQKAVELEGNSEAAQNGLKRFWIQYRKSPQGIQQQNNNIQLYEGNPSPNLMGFLYEYFDKKYDEAMQCYRATAEQGNPEGQDNLGRMYANSIGVQQNDAEAFKWFRKAAEQKHLPGQVHLGIMYRDGRGVHKNYTEAVKCFEEAAKQRNADGEYNLGIMYFQGLGVDKNIREAKNWFMKAANKKNTDGLYGLGIILRAEKNYVAAKRNFKEAAKNMNTNAQNSLGMLYRDGLGTQKNDKKAVDWFKKAAEQDHPSSQNNLGTMYRDGRGIQKDHGEAVKWFRKAAEKGDVNGQYNLGVAYYDGSGVTKSYDEAANWFRKAASKGHSSSKNRLEQMEKQGQAPQKAHECINDHIPPLSQDWIIKSTALTWEFQVGEGGSGNIYKAQWGGSAVAFKQLKDGLNNEDLQGLHKEAEMMSKLRHPHVVQFYGITDTQPYRIVMEWMEKGSFYQALLQEKLNFEKARKILLGVANGLVFLHGKGITHGDIKSQNILLDQNYNAKIADFGLSQGTKSLISAANQGSSAGSPPWQAPELFEKKPHTPASDVYAFGIVMWEALTAQIPYQKEEFNTDQISGFVLAGKRPDIPDGTPNWYQQLMKRCWSQNPQDRPKAEEIASRITTSQELNQTEGYLDHTLRNAASSLHVNLQTSGYLDNA
jgi:TPR repeat protein